MQQYATKATMFNNPHDGSTLLLHHTAGIKNCMLHELQAEW
jgi:hypothetical protein